MPLAAASAAPADDRSKVPQLISFTYDLHEGWARFQVWAYDANDLLAVEQGLKHPWDVKPYALWTLTLPFDSGRIAGATIDPARGLIYVTQSYGNGSEPVVHVFKLS